MDPNAKLASLRDKLLAEAALAQARAKIERENVKEKSKTVEKKRKVKQ